MYKTRTTHIRQNLEKKRLENELKLKADFTAMLVHDLKNPLQCIVGYSELLKMRSQNNEDKKSSEIIKSAVNVMIDMINNMLDIYKLEAKKLVVKKEQVILGALVYDVTMLMKPLLSSENIKLERHYEVSDFIQADPNPICRVINNLLSNAIKFSPKNGVITITIKRIEVKGAFFHELSVQDQGAGIELDKQAYLFNAYAQLEDKTGKLPKGTGLGLAVSKLIIEAHGGAIGYRPGKGGGSEFYFQLPEA
jgi:signal transduction histidine kinase